MDSCASKHMTPPWDGLQHLQAKKGKVFIGDKTSVPIQGIGDLTGSMFSMRGAAVTLLTRGYATLGNLERMCSHVQFVSSIVLHGVQIWGPSLGHRGHSRRAYDGWRSMEQPLVTMIAKIIHCKACVPHDRELRP